MAKTFVLFLIYEFNWNSTNVIFCQNNLVCHNHGTLSGVFIQQVIRQIGDIQNVDSFECTWKKFDICAIVIPYYEHTLSIHYILSFDI